MINSIQCVSQYAIRGSVVMFCLFFLLSCNEQSLNDKGVNNVNNNPQYDPPLAWENPNNPYDSIGYYHNQALEYVISFREQLDCDDSAHFLQQVQGYIVDYYCSHNWYYGSGNCTDYMDSIIANYISARNNLTSQDQLVDLFAVDVDSKTAMLNLMNNIVESYTDSTDFSPLYESIIDWEDDVINSNYSIQCKKQLLAESSVMRYSLHYWNGQRLLGELSPWNLPCGGGILNPKHEIILGNSKNITGFWNTLLGVLCTAAADAVGAGIGAVGGSPLGPFGAAVEAVGVGAFASIGVASVYNW